jgi:hypothetical protein
MDNYFFDFLELKKKGFVQQNRHKCWHHSYGKGFGSLKVWYGGQRS